LPTWPEGTVHVDHVWKRFRADRALPVFVEQVKLLGRRLRGGQRDWRWVLRDVNLHIEPGRTHAIVGVNGSGKSTLLKIMCKTTFPSAGRVDAMGRIGALLEVRSGIHPELTGRENVFLYGNILGLSRREVANRFDDIVDFAEIGAAIDRQVKFYSAGMAIRLGFAIAVFLDPAILLVDEVLAVGDAHFQQKCLQRINEVVAMGTTLVFVSHDLAAVEAVCERATWLADSYVMAEGPTRAVLARYRASVHDQTVMSEPNPDHVRVLKVEVNGPEGNQVLSNEPVELRISVRSPRQMFVSFIVGVTEGTAQPVFINRFATSLPEGEAELRCRIRHLPLPRGRYWVWGTSWEQDPEGPVCVLPWQPFVPFEAYGPQFTGPPPGVMLLSPVHVDAAWELC